MSHYYYRMLIYKIFNVTPVFYFKFVEIYGKLYIFFKLFIFIFYNWNKLKLLHIRSLFREMFNLRNTQTFDSPWILYEKFDAD